MISIWITETKGGYRAITRDARHSVATDSGVVATIKACAAKALMIPVHRLTAEPEQPGQFIDIPVNCWWAVKEKS